jgi:ketosteroid isomerase-like protein
MAKLATVSNETQSNEVLIREQIDGFMKAVRDKDLTRMMSYYAPDIVSFDIIPPLKYDGIQAYRKSWQKGLAMMQGPIEFEARDLHIDASDQIAFCRAINRMKFTSDGKETEMWVRWTGCFRNIDGNWLVTHEHVSVPVDMETDKALYGLKP